MDDKAFAAELDRVISIAYTLWSPCYTEGANEEQLRDYQDMLLNNATMAYILIHDAGMCSCLVCIFLI